MEKSENPDKRRKYDAAFRAEALRLAEQSRGPRTEHHPKMLCRWQQAQVVAEVGSEALARDPEKWALRAANKRLAQKVGIFKKAIAIFSTTPPTPGVAIALLPPSSPTTRCSCFVA
jgi:transposase